MMGAWQHWRLPRSVSRTLLSVILGLSSVQSLRQGNHPQLSTPTPKLQLELCMERDRRFMRIALEEAKTALDFGEVPVGCVVVRGGRIIGRGHNLTNRWLDSTRHAEMVAVDNILGNGEAEDDTGRSVPTDHETGGHDMSIERDSTSSWKSEPRGMQLRGSELFVTLEPCIMCASALGILGVRRVVFGCSNTVFGGCGSVLALHQVAWRSAEHVASLAEPESPSSSAGATKGGHGTGSKRKDVVQGAPAGENTGDGRKSEDAEGSAAEGGQGGALREHSETNGAFTEWREGLVGKEGGDGEGQFESVSGVLEEESIAILQRFYRQGNPRAPQGKRKRWLVEREEGGQGESGHGHGTGQEGGRAEGGAVNVREGRTSSGRGGGELEGGGLPDSRDASEEQPVAREGSGGRQSDVGARCAGGGCCSDKDGSALQVQLRGGGEEERGSKSGGGGEGRGAQWQDWTWDGVPGEEDELAVMSDKVGRMMLDGGRVPAEVDMAENQNASLLHEYAAGLAARNDTGAAELLMRRSLLLDPFNTEALCEYGAMVEQRKKFSLAENMYRRALAVDGKQTEALVRYGRLQLLSLRNHDGARRLFEQALDGDPRNLEALFHMGLISQDHDRDYEQAKRFYQAALEISPDEPRVLAAYGHLLARRLGNFHLGLFLVRKALALDPANQSIKSLVSTLTLRRTVLRDLMDKDEPADEEERESWVRLVDSRRVEHDPAESAAPAEEEGEGDAHLASDGGRRQQSDVSQEGEIVVEDPDMDHQELQERLDAASRPEWLVQGPPVDAEHTAAP